MADFDSLYHYCSSETFSSIVRKRSIWLSSLRLSNDSAEGQLTSAALMRLAMRDGLAMGMKDELKKDLSFFESAFDGLGFCLSKEGDLLSQWRGYADDAHGVSIGFSKKYLESLSDSSKGRPGFISLNEIVYENNEHEDCVAPTYESLKKYIEEGALSSGGKVTLGCLISEDLANAARETHVRARENFLMCLLGLLPQHYALKSKAFLEEREWRLVSMRTEGVYEECQFRAVRNKLIPYREVVLEDLGCPSIVRPPT